MTGLAEHPCGLEPGRPGADDQHRSGMPSGLDALRMPAAPPFLAHRGVLRAADRTAAEIVGVTHVAADAFADLIEPSAANLLRQERVGDRGTRGADEVEHAAAYLTEHGIGRGETAHPDHRTPGEGSNALDLALEGALAHEARGRHLLAVVIADHHVPQVCERAELGQQLV